jgi:hypothetical protein
VPCSNQGVARLKSLSQNEGMKFAEPTLPGLPFPADSDSLMEMRDEALEYLGFVARNYPPTHAALEIQLAAERLIQIIEADYAATAREIAEDEADA